MQFCAPCSAPGPSPPHFHLAIPTHGLMERSDVGAGKQEWSPQGDKEPAHNRTRAEERLPHPRADCGRCLLATAGSRARSECISLANEGCAGSEPPPATRRPLNPIAPPVLRLPCAA